MKKINNNINIEVNKEVKLDIVKKLEIKMEKRIGMLASTTDKCKVGTITGFTIETVDAGSTTERLTVNYLLAHGTHPHAELRLVNENLVVIMKEPNN